MFIEASMAKYQMATNTGKMIAIDFACNIYKFVSEEKDYTVSEQNWIRGFMAALARRKMKTVHAFCAINLDIVNQKKKTKGGEYSVLFARFLQRLFEKGEPHGQNLLAVVNEIKKDKMPEPTYDYALLIDGPVIDMFTPLMMHSEKESNEMCLHALECHKKYWNTQLPNTFEGLISLNITALTVMAKDYDFKIEHISDYIVHSLVVN